jgi:molybdopterin-guanine dinucleotide biosynthesis protein
MHLHPRTVEIVIGVQGSGKTTLIKELIFDHDRVFVVDQRDEYDIGEAWTNFEAMALAAEKRERFVFVWKGERKMADAIAHLAFALSPATKEESEHRKGPCIVLSEAEELLDDENNVHIRKAVLTGRKPARISIIADFQWPTQAEPWYRSQVTGVWAFFNAEKSALEWLKTYFRELTKEISALPPLHGFVWRWGGGPVERFEVQP